MLIVFFLLSAYIIYLLVRAMPKVSPNALAFIKLSFSHIVNLLIVFYTLYFCLIFGAITSSFTSIMLIGQDLSFVYKWLLVTGIGGVLGTIIYFLSKQFSKNLTSKVLLLLPIIFFTILFMIIIIIMTPIVGVIIASLIGLLIGYVAHHISKNNSLRIYNSRLKLTKNKIMMLSFLSGSTGAIIGPSETMLNTLELSPVFWLVFISLNLYLFFSVLLKLTITKKA